MQQTDPALDQWPFIKKQAVLFFFIFFVLYIFLNPNEIVPYSYYLHILYLHPCASFITWLAKDALHVVDPAVSFYNSTIDTAFGYFTIAFIAFVALCGSIIGVVLDRHRRNYHWLYNVLIVILRYFLAVCWIAYASLKIAGFQFPAISNATLMQTYGNSTPKELAWAFMGYSTGYNYFIGFIEYVVGLLLFFRKTSALGCVIALGILANVVAFNYTFGVNVKILSTILMLMTLFLLSKNISRLVDFFLLNKTVFPVDDVPFRFKKQWKNAAVRIVKYAFIVYIIFFDLSGDFARIKHNGTGLIKPPLYGIYNITSFIRNNDTLKPLTTDTIRWNKLIISAPKGKAGVMLMSDSGKDFVFNADTVNRKIVMYAKMNPADKYTFDYNRPKDRVLLLRGKWHNDSLEIKLQQLDMNELPINKEQFQVGN